MSNSINDALMEQYFQEAVELGLQGKKAEEYALQKMEEKGDDPYE